MFRKSPLAWVPLPEEGTNCAQAPWQRPPERVPESLLQTPLFLDYLNVLSPEEASVHRPGTWSNHCQAGP